MPRIIYNDHPNTLAMQEFMRRAAAGHVMGTTRMGLDPKRSVVNEFCQSHDVPNLFIGGSSVFVTSAGVNPTLTIFALAYRTAECISRLWKQSAFLYPN